MLEISILHYKTSLFTTVKVLQQFQTNKLLCITTVFTKYLVLSIYVQVLQHMKVLQEEADKERERRLLKERGRELYSFKCIL